MGSDGLFDNVFDHEIISTLANHKDVVETGTYLQNFIIMCLRAAGIFKFNEIVLVSMVAKVLADLAYKHSVDFYFDSPYSIKARTRVNISFH